MLKSPDSCFKENNDNNLAKYVERKLLYNFGHEANNHYSML